MEGIAVYIYNAQNHPGRDDVQWADGRHMGMDELLEPIVYTETLVDRIYAITDNAFTDEQIEKFGNDFFSDNAQYLIRYGRSYGCVLQLPCI